MHGDASTHYDDRSEQWQGSEEGQAFYIWVTALEELADFDPEPVDTVRIAIDLSGEGPVVDTLGDPCWCARPGTAIDLVRERLSSA